MFCAAQEVEHVQMKEMYANDLNQKEKGEYDMTFYISILFYRFGKEYEYKRKVLVRI